MVKRLRGDGLRTSSMKLAHFLLLHLLLHLSSYKVSDTIDREFSQGDVLKIIKI